MATSRARKDKAGNGPTSKAKGKAPGPAVAVTVIAPVDSLAATNRERAIDSFARPKGWPEDLPFDLRRFFGPFWSGSDLSEIRAAGPWNAAALYFGAFFIDNPQNALYAPAFGNNLPNQAAPRETPVPGNPRAIQFALDQVSFRARYGGSVELRMPATTSTGIELAAGGHFWDLDGLVLRIYVSPTARAFNDLNRVANQGRVACEFTYRRAVAYDVGPAPGAPWAAALPNTPTDALDAQLRTHAGTLANSLDDLARRFVVGYLRAKFPDRLATDGVVVDGLILEDNLCVPVTHVGAPHLHIATTVGAAFNGWDEPGRDELRLEISTILDRSPDSPVPGPSYVQNVAGQDSTSWLSIAWLTMPELPGLNAVEITVGGAELDRVSGHDRFDPKTFRVALDIAAIQARAAANAFGVIEDRMLFDDHVRTDGGGHTELVTRIRVQLVAT